MVDLTWYSTEKGLEHHFQQLATGAREDAHCIFD